MRCFVAILIAVTVAAWTITLAIPASTTGAPLSCPAPEETR
jgi:hypothetical protein